MENALHSTNDASLVSVHALRALAAISIVLVHFEYIDHALTGRINEQLSLYPLASGVDLFFVISGFIMVYSSAGLFTKDAAWRIFIARRISRIVPLYWLMTAASIAMFSMPESWQMLVSSLLFIPYRTASGSFFPVDAGGWTLNYEMFFYTLFALAIFLPRQVAVAAVGSFLLALVTIFRFVPDWADNRLFYWSDPIVLEFVMGMAIGLLSQHYRVKLPAWLCLSMIVVGSSAVWLSGPGGTIPSGNRALVWGIPVAVLFSGAVLGPRPDFKWLTWPAMALGDASYALYLTHPIVGGAIIRGYLAGPLTRYQLNDLMIGGILISILLSMAIFRWFERPATRLLRGFIDRRLKVVWVQVGSRCRPVLDLGSAKCLMSQQRKGGRVV